MNEDYPAFEKWYKIQDWILDKSEKFPKSVRFTFNDRIVNISIDITEKLIESIYSKEKKELLYQVNINIEKLRVFFRISMDRKYISFKSYEFISLELNEFGSMIGGWVKSLK